MKRLLILLTVISSVLSAQEESSASYFAKHRIGFNLGGSSAQSAYSDASIEDTDAGFAEGGISYRLTYEYRIDENKSATFLLGRARNGLASESFANILNVNDRVDTVRWNVNADDYQLAFGLVGIKLIHGEAVRIYVNPMLGVASMTSPEVRIRAKRQSGAIINQKIRESDPATAIMLGISGGLDFDLSDIVSLNFDVLYLTSEFKLTSELETFDSNGSPDILSETGDQPYSTLNISVGLGINF